MDQGLWSPPPPKPKLLCWERMCLARCSSSIRLPSLASCFTGSGSSSRSSRWCLRSARTTPLYHRRLRTRQRGVPLRTSSTPWCCSLPPAPSERRWSAVWCRSPRPRTRRRFYEQQRLPLHRAIASGGSTGVLSAVSTEGGITHVVYRN